MKHSIVSASTHGNINGKIPTMLPCRSTSSRAKSLATLAIMAFANMPRAAAFVASPGRPVVGVVNLQQRVGSPAVRMRRLDVAVGINIPADSALEERTSERRVGRRGGIAALSMGSDDEGDSDGAVAESNHATWPTINRKAIGALATVGALESAFLTYQKIKPGGLDLLCGASGGCADVLSGPYSNVLGFPLSAFGLMGYAAVAILALGPLWLEGEAIDKFTRSCILMITTAMGIFSVYLLSILKFKIGYPCPWCLTSAGLSLSMCTVAWVRRAVPQKTKAAVMGVCTSLVTAFACLTIFVVTETALDIRQAEASPGELVGLELVAAPAIDTESSPQAVRVGKKLKALDAKMYGAYWCTHCFHQKELLGKQAMSKVKYVECSNRGVDNQVDMCKAAKVPGFPTWDIDGKLYPGEQTLEELEEIVGLEPFKG